MPESSDMMLIASPNDLAVVVDPRVVYQPAQVRGIVYTVKAEPPRPPRRD
jgi:hypothetical protein